MDPKKDLGNHRDVDVAVVAYRPTQKLYEKSLLSAANESEHRP